MPEPVQTAIAVGDGETVVVDAPATTPAVQHEAQRAFEPAAEQLAGQMALTQINE
jgi:hypothetical protein